MNSAQITTVDFDHAFFRSVEGSYFRRLEDTNTPAFVMVLNEGEVSLNFEGIKRELKLTEEDLDAAMLDAIAEGLKYVTGLKIGDPLPSEILNGQASWVITNEHRKIATNRVTMQLVSWLSGEELLISEPEQLSQIAEDPKTREKVNSAFSEAAKALGIKDEEKGSVVSLVGNLAEELCYIEALRMTYNRIEMIQAMINDLEKKYSSELSVMETIRSVNRLLKIAVDGFKDSFEQIDAQTGEILSALKNIAQTTKFIRDNRDDLHCRFLSWTDILNDWHAEQPRRSRRTEELLDKLYSFLAQRFLPVQEWELLSQVQDKSKGTTTEMIW